MRWIIKILTGPQAKRTFECTEADIVIVGGAEPARIVLDDPHVSSVHCAMEVCGTRCFLRDLKSTNGTWLNGQRVAEAEIRSGDQIRIGRTVMGIRSVGRSSDAPTSPVCVRCGAPLAEAGSVKSVHAFMCANCTTSDLEARRRTAQYSVEAACRRCGIDVSDVANLDGRAFELAAVAEYLCPACTSAGGPVAGASTVASYRILDRIGIGGFGEVWSASHKLTGRLAAVKTILPAATRDERVSDWFLREVAVARELVHPNVVRLYESGADGETLYFAAEYVEGSDLESAMEHEFRGPMPPALAVEYIVQALDALEYAHTQGIVHRDVKPSNLLRTRQRSGRREVKVSDFGLAKRFATAGVSVLTEAGESRGTPAFMAREQFLNFRFVGPSADVYSTGVVLYYLLTGSLPFDHPSPLERANNGGTGHANDLVRIILEEDRIPILEKRPQLPEALAAVVDIAVQRDQSDRFETAAGLRNELVRAARAL